jgi:hypothetical protein
LLQAAGFIHSQHAWKLRRLHFVLKQLVQLPLSIRTARRPRSAGFPLIGTNKNVPIEWWQSKLLIKNVLLHP